MIRLILFALLSFAVVPCALAATAVEKLTTPSGIAVWYVQDKTTPSMTVSFAFRGGSEEDPDAQQGRAHLMASLLTEGTDDISATVFQQRLNDSNISLGFSAGREAINGDLRFLTRYADEAIALARAALLHPAFRPDDVERTRQQMLAGLNNVVSDPDWRAQRLMMQQLFGGTRYAVAPRGTPATLPNLTADSVVMAHRHHIARARLIVAAVGAPDAAEAMRIIDGIFGDIPAGTAWQVPHIEIKERGAVWYSPWQGGAQNNVMFAAPSLQPTDSDYPAALVLNDIFGGGGFRSLLMDELRQNMGATYGAGTSLTLFAAAPVQMGRGAMVADKANDAMALITELWTHLGDNITPERIADSVTYISGSLTRDLTSSSAIADYYLGLQLQGLPSDYADRLPQQLQVLTEAELRRVAERLYTREALSFVVVGPTPPTTITRTVNDVWTLE